MQSQQQQQQHQQQQQSGFGSGVGGGLLINDKRPRLERAVSYDRESSSVGVSAGFGHHHHRTSSTSSVDPSGIIRSGSSLAGGQPAGYPNTQPQQQNQQHQQLPNRGQLQRSGSLQSHGTSSWRNNSVPHQMSSDLIDNSPARGGGGPVGGVAEYGPSVSQQQQQAIYPSSGRGSSVPLTAGMGSSSGQQQQHQFRRGASSSSWSDYRGDNFDKLNPQQQQFLQQQQLNSVHPRSTNNPGLVKVRSSSYDHGDYYQDDYNRGQGGGQRLSGGVSSAERSLPVVHPQQHLRQQQQQRQQHPAHHHHHHHHHHRQHQSSSEEELRSTSECTSCEDVEVESESVSEKERPLRPRPLGSVGGTMISRSSSSSGAPEADGRGGYTTRSGGRDQYGAYRGGSGGGSVGRLHVGVGVGGGGRTSVDTASSAMASAECSAQRRSFFQQRGQERRLPDAPSDGVIRSASLQHQPSLSISSSSSMMAVSAGPTALSSSTSAIHGTNHIHHHHNQRQHSLNRSLSNSSGVARISSSASIPTSASKSTIAGGNNNNNNNRQLKKTVRFDADEDGPATTTTAAAVTTTTTTTTISSSSSNLPSRNLKANGLLRSESSLLASSTVADASWKGDNKTWDWLMKGHGDGGDNYRHHHHQDSRESAGRDSGVETLTSGEDVVVVVPRSKHHSASYDHHHHHHQQQQQQHRPKHQLQKQQHPPAPQQQHPVTWQPNSDGTKMIGRMILTKNMAGIGVGSLGGGGGGGGGPSGVSGIGGSSNPSSASILGLKVVGGKRVDNGRLAAIVEKVKRGSVADTIGHLRPGDEVLEWNGYPLQGRTFEEVYDIICESRSDHEVEIIVSRPISDVGRPSSMGAQSGGSAGPGGGHLSHHHSGYGSASGSLAGVGGGGGGGAGSTRSGGSKVSSNTQRDRPAVTVTSPASPDTLHPSWGKVQVKLWYDASIQQLSATIVGGFDLPPRPNGALRNPYAKLFLLPDKSEKSKRRTRALASTLEPRWNQTFLYSHLRRSELRSRFLEITVWDSDRLDTGRLIGEVVIDLGAAPLDGEADWYTLTSHEESLQILRRAGLQMSESATSPVGSVDHLSPPSTSSRLSDSEPDPSDLGDGEEGGGGGSGGGGVGGGGSGGMGGPLLPPSRHSRGALERSVRSDGASVSSMGSSSSPPLDSDYGEQRRSRTRTGTIVASDDKYLRGGGPILDRSRPRSHSAAPDDIGTDRGRLERTPSQRSSIFHDRAKSPRRVSEPGRRSLSPSEERLPDGSVRGGMYGGSGIPRMTSRSATATPTGSPKRRHLPQIPSALQQTSFARVRQDVEERARMLKLRMGQIPSSGYSVGGGERGGGGGGGGGSGVRSWRMYSGHSDNDLPPQRHSVTHRGSSSGGHYSSKGSGMSRTSRSLSGAGPDGAGGKVLLSPDREGRDRSGAERGGGGGSGSGGAGGGDSDVESLVSFVSGTSALSTQSERPSAYVKRVGERREEMLTGELRDRGGQEVGPANSDGGRSGSSFRRNQLGRSLSQSDVPVTEKNDGSLSDTALNSSLLDCQLPDRTTSSWRRGASSSASSSGGLAHSSSASQPQQLYAKNSDKGGLSKKSNSTSQLSATGRKRKMGFGRKDKNAFSVHRSEEVMPNTLRHLVRQSSSLSSTEGLGDGESGDVRGTERSGSKGGGKGGGSSSSNKGGSSNSNSRKTSPSPRRGNMSSAPSVESDGDGSRDKDGWVGLARLTAETAGSGPLADFVEGLGPGQLVGRQVLAAPALGDVQLALCDRKGRLEVEVIRARGLQARTGSKLLPAPYVKVYLVSGKRCLAKAKTATARRTLDPLYQQQLSFSVLYQGCVLQVTVWGDYGRIEGRKVFMGVAQILLDDLDLSNIVIGWYKLFGTASLVSLPPPQSQPQQQQQQQQQQQPQQQQQQQQHLPRRSSQHSLDSNG
ncbi:regulating synaptic membrane exocytosis protein 2-like isoform X4 [Daphnia pulicaria]|nr:regulating synaptic membrane exocytosis protein 2-like isoform X4 [Daphnia pulicaria]